MTSSRIGNGRVWVMAVWALAVGCARPSVEERAGDWPAYGSDQGATQYTALDQINRDNVGTLEVAWEWETGETSVSGPRSPVPGAGMRPGAFENTPLVFHDTMIVTTPYNRVVALDASSGRELWSYDQSSRPLEASRATTRLYGVVTIIVSWKTRGVFSNAPGRIPAPGTGERGPLTDVSPVSHSQATSSVPTLSRLIWSSAVYWVAP